MARDPAPDGPPEPGPQPAATPPREGALSTPPAPGDPIWMAIVESSRDLVVLVDGQGSPVYLNPAVRQLVGFEPDELLDVNPLDYIHPDDRAGTKARLDVATTDSRVHGIAVMRVQHRDGSSRWIETLASDRLDDPEVGAIIVNARDITERVLAEQALATETERYRLLVETLPDIVMRFDRDLAIRYINPAGEKLIDHLSDPEQDAAWSEDAATEARDALEAVLATGEPRRYESPLEMDGQMRWYEVTAIPDLDIDGVVEAITTIGHDVTDRKAAEQHLALRSFEDAFTGLLNRSGFMLALDEAAASGSAGLALLYLDIDHFKQVNDERGHAAGDDLLRAVARGLQAAVRPGDLVARLGGDEFVILPAGLSSATTATDLADRLHSSLSGLACEVAGVTAGTVSIGVALVAAGIGAGGDEILACADAAMYEAKRAGRGRTVVRSVEQPAI